MYKVIIVDDEPYIREGLTRLIPWEDYGLEVCGESDNGIAALKMIHALNPEIVITDIKMPEMDGLEMIKKSTQGLNSHCKFIILSGYEDFKYAQAAMKYDVSQYILKPIDEDELIQALLELKKTITKEKNKENEERIGEEAIARDTIRKLLAGKIDDNITEFSGRLLNANNGEPLSFILIEIINYKDFLVNQNSDEFEISLADTYRNIVKTIGKENTMNITEEGVFRFGVLVNSQILNRYNGNLELLCNKLYKNISDDSKRKTAVYAGRRVTRLLNVETSYQSCFHAMEKNFFHREPGVIYYSDIKNNTFNYHFKNEISNTRLLYIIANNKIDELQIALEDYFAALEKQSLAPEVVRACVIEFMLEAVKIISDNNGDADNLVTHFRINDISRLSINDLKKLQYNFCVSSAGILKKLRKNSHSDIISEVESFIRHNYKNNINLKSISEHFYINPVYLGQLFKKTTGAYFNDYLHDLRIKEAVNLLSKTKMKIYEISGEVGYSDSDYFIRKFKKTMGTSPSKYRKA